MARLISKWEPEDEQFWERTGKGIAYRNLWISIPCLLCAFAVWLYWSVIIVQMQNLGYPFSKEQLYTLGAIPGLLGATLRIPHSFFIALSGGRNVVFTTTAMLIAPALGVGIALGDLRTSYWTFAVLGALWGIGGGAFASSMSNISFFFPKRMQGLSLGLNAGLGNLGVSVMQVLVPFVVTFSLFGSLGGPGRPLLEELGGDMIWIQNTGLVWVPVLVVLTILSWFLMDNLPMHQVGATLPAIGRILWLVALAFASGGIGAYLLVGRGWNMWLVLPLTIILTVVFMRYLAVQEVRQNLSDQFVIFGEKHNWVMTWLYTMTFGSFIGYSAAFPKLIQDVFG